MRTLFMAMLLISAPGGALAAQVSISSAASHSSGRYGAAKATTVTSTSLGANATLGEWEVSATLPYISVGVGGSELTVGGVVIQPQDGAERLEGFGDVYVTVGRSLPLPDDFPFEVGLKGELKLPTGARILSTGTIDGGVDIEFSRSFGAVAPFASVGRRFYGDTEDLELENGWVASAGATFTLLGLTLIASYEWAESPIGLPAAKEIFGVASGSFARNWNWTVFGSKGLNEGAADLMFGFGLSCTFGSGTPGIEK